VASAGQDGAQVVVEVEAKAKAKIPIRNERMPSGVELPSSEKMPLAGMAIIIRYWEY